MKQYFFLFVMILSLFGWQSQAGSIEINDGENTLNVKVNTYQKLQLNATLSEIRTLEVNTDMGLFTTLNVDGYAHSETIGAPDLPIQRKLIEVPFNADVRVNILSVRSREVSLQEAGLIYPVMPAQPPVPKDGDLPPFEYDHQAYQTDSFFPADLVTVDHAGIMRGTQLALLNMAAVQYNPVTGMLRIIEEIDVEILFENADIALTLEEKKKNDNMYFRPVGRHVLNYKENGNRDTISDYPIKFVIVSDPMFRDQLQPFIEWKTKKGFTVIEAYTDDPAVGNTTFQIKAYLETLYDNGRSSEVPPSFVLFVGDVEQIPAWIGNAGGHVTDLFYCEYTNDYFPEVFYGRFSAKTTDQLQPQLDKTMQYEQYTMPDPSYLNEVVMVAGMDSGFGASHGNGQINYGTINYFNSTNGIVSHTYLYPQSGNNSANIIQDVSNGVTFGNYTAHCSPNGWADPSFSISDIPTLQNQDKYGLLIGNCCSSSEYQQSECFGEEIVRAENKGCVGYIGASNSSYWDEDYYFGVGVGQISENPPPYEATTLGVYDRVWHTHGEPFDDWYTTMDQMVFAGNLAVTEGSPSSAEYYWEMYCVLGDPSLMIYFSVPSEISVSHLPILILNTTEFIVNTEPYAYVALSRDGVLHGAVLADASGLAVVPISPFTVPGMVDLVVTKQNGQPYIGTVLANDPEGPYITVNEYHAFDITGNLNNKIEYGEVAAMNLELKNWGNTNGSEVMVNLVTSDPYISITDGSEFLATVTAQDSIMLENAFSFIVDPAVPDGHVILFEIEIEDVTDETWYSEAEVQAFAPVFTIVEISIDDSESGNGNSMLDPGEDVEITVVYGNDGNAIAPDTYTELIARTAFVNIDDATRYIGNFGFFGNTTLSFQAHVTEDAPEGIVFDLVTAMTSGELDHEQAHPTRIGMVCEDFETGDFDTFDWVQGGTQPWEITTEFPFEGFFSIRSGDIDNGQNSTLSLTYEVMTADSITFYRKVSSESGDKLKFLINDEVMGEWSGTTVGWRRESYPVTAGVMTFEWVYQKNGSGSTGADRGWLDLIVLPAPMKTTLYAGDDDIACGDDSYQLSGSATDYISVTWTSSGTGTFDDPNILNPTYNPGGEDVTTGTVDLTLSVTGSGNAEYADPMTLVFEETPGQASQPSGPTHIDLETVMVSEYSSEGIEGIDAFSWSIEPAEAGTFAGNGETVTLVWDRSFSGEAIISVAAENHCGTGEFSEGLLVTVDNFVDIREPISETIGVSVYPNPNNGSFNIHFDGKDYGNLDIYLLNIIGQSVYFKSGVNSTDTHFQADPDQLEAGIYFLVIESQDAMTTKKLIIKP